MLNSLDASPSDEVLSKALGAVFAGLEMPSDVYVQGVSNSFEQGAPLFGSPFFIG